MKSSRMDRRTFLRASGVLIGLPFLEAMVPASAVEAKKALAQPPRMVLVGQGLGMYAPNFFPEKAGRDYEASRYLKLLQAHRDQFTVFSGMSHRYATGHFAEVGIFTGVSPEMIRERDIKNSISLDQEAASHIGNQTRCQSLVLGSGNVAWSRRGVRVPPERSALATFERLFGAGTPEGVAREVQRIKDGQSILDDVGEQIKSINRKVGSNDRDRLDLFLTSVREAEQTLKQDEAWSHTPKPKVDFKPPAKDIPETDLIANSRLWYDIVHLALQTDSTRVVSLWLSSQQKTDVPHVDLGHHDASHHGQAPEKLEQLALIEEAEMQMFGEFLEKLKASKEGDHNLLDRTAVLYTSNLGNSSSHDNNNLPIILAGGTFKHQGHLAFDTKKNTLFSNLFVRMLHHMDIEAKSFNGSNGIASEV